MADAVQHPLFDIELEQALIGAFLVDSKNIAIARSTAAAEDFSDDLHQLIVTLIYEFDEEGKAVNPVTLNSWIKHNPAVKNADKLYGEELPPGREGGAYLAYLAGAAPALPNVQAYAVALADLALRRRAVWAMGEAQDALSAREKSVPAPILTALAPIVQIADEIAEKQIGDDVSTRAGDRGDVMLRQIQEQAASGQEFGVQTGLEPLDELIGGLYPENLIIIGGRPGMGKSILACRLLLSAAWQDYEADYWSIEMPGREVMARLVCDVDYDLAMQERLDPLHYEDLVKMRADGAQLHRAAMANERLRELNINIFDRSRVMMRDIVSVTRARKARNPGRKRLTVIDHLHIIMADDRYRGNRVNELSEITGQAKRLAKQTEGPVVLLSQLSRDLERRDDKHPFMSDFRDSGSIEQDADVVIALYRADYYRTQAFRQAKNEEQRAKIDQQYGNCQDVLEAEVLKQRSGATRSVDLHVEVKSSVVRGTNPRQTRTAAQQAMDFALANEGRR